MYTLLRWIAEWKGRRSAAQVIVFDGGAEVERTRAFLQGVAVGGGCVLLALLLTAPTSADPTLVREAARRELLLREAEGRVGQAVAIADACLSTARTLGETLQGYRDMVEEYPGVLGRRR
jgi:gas vesicle protein